MCFRIRHIMANPDHVNRATCRHAAGNRKDDVPGSCVPVKSFQANEVEQLPKLHAAKFGKRTNARHIRLASPIAVHGSPFPSEETTMRPWWNPPFFSIGQLHDLARFPKARVLQTNGVIGTGATLDKGSTMVRQAWEAAHYR